MPESLGEKLRQAREERDITISEVAEQTRISASYLEAIENNDYGPLPGGIFNKGFVKSFAKYVGVDESEAVQDYARIVAANELDDLDKLKAYKPEVLTDDRSGPSLIPTIIFAVVILGLLFWGVKLFVDYWTDTPSAPSPNNVNSNSNDLGSVTNSNAETSAKLPLPSLDQINIGLKTTAPELSIQSEVDGKIGSVVLTPQNGWEAEAKERVRITYYKGLAETVKISVNGRPIETPIPPPDYRKQGFDVVIDKSNLKQILESGKISNTVSVPGSNENPISPANTPADGSTT